MAYLYCTRCKKFYLSEHLNGSICPDATCEKRLVEIDENMVVPIGILNEKGYITAYCCSGHVHRHICGGYIAFRPDSPLPHSTPKGWTWDKTILDNGQHCIRWSFKRGDNIIDRQKMILQKTQALVNWCENLRDANEEG